MGWIFYNMPKTFRVCLYINIHILCVDVEIKYRHFIILYTQTRK